MSKSNILEYLLKGAIATSSFLILKKSYCIIKHSSLLEILPLPFLLIIILFPLTSAFLYYWKNRKVNSKNIVTLLKERNYSND